MTTLEKYELVNMCDTPAELSDAILKCSVNGLIEGRRQQFDAALMSRDAIEVIAGLLSPNRLTRTFGIRQQALYIKYHEKNI